jgi:hypothetical protein
MTECQKAPTRFVILAAPRTGSALLCTLLDSHPEILCHHEVFSPLGIFYAPRYRDGSLNLGTADDRDRSPIAFLERLWQENRGHRCVGFKFTRGRGQNDTMLRAVLGDHDVRKIVLSRRNRVKAYVSTLIAELTGQWEVFRETDLIRDKPKVEINVDRLQRHVEMTVNYYAEIEESLRNSGQTRLRIAYEDLLQPRQHEQWLDYLGLPSDSFPLVAETVKQNPIELRQLVSNYEDLLDALRGTALESELCSLEP